MQLYCWLLKYIWSHLYRHKAEKREIIPRALAGELIVPKWTILSVSDFWKLWSDIMDPDCQIKKFRLKSNKIYSLIWMCMALYMIGMLFSASVIMEIMRFLKPFLKPKPRSGFCLYKPFYCYRPNFLGIYWTRASLMLNRG